MSRIVFAHSRTARLPGAWRKTPTSGETHSHRMRSRTRNSRIYRFLFAVCYIATTLTWPRSSESCSPHTSVQSSYARYVDGLTGPETEGRRSEPQVATDTYRIVLIDSTKTDTCFSFSEQNLNNVWIKWKWIMKLRAFRIRQYARRTADMLADRRTHADRITVVHRPQRNEVY